MLSKNMYFICTFPGHRDVLVKSCVLGLYFSGTLIFLSFTQHGHST